MKTIVRCLPVLIFLFCNAVVLNCQNKLYYFKETNVFGYIDKEGNVALKPRFRGAGVFNEGLAPVRTSGTYGYINTKGEWIIQPQFDYAFPFSHGRARVYFEGKLRFIDYKGKILFSHPFKDIQNFNERGFTIAETYSGKLALINDKGKLLTDTAFSNIGDFYYGVAVVEGLLNKDEAKNPNLEPLEVGLIDTLGNWKINYGIYQSITPLCSGFGVARFFDTTRIIPGDYLPPGTWIDTEGKPFEDFADSCLWQDCEEIWLKSRDRLRCDSTAEIELISDSKHPSIKMYRNNQGRIIHKWEEEDWQATPLDLDYMNPVNYYNMSGETQVKKRISSFYGANKKSILYIDTMQQNKGTYTLYVGNFTGEALTLYMQSGDGFPLLMQALDKTGVWRDIEITRYTGDGCLQIDEFQIQNDSILNFSIHKYMGELRTRLRMKLEVKLEGENKAESFIYSNEISGSVNPGQFIYIREHFH